MAINLGFSGYYHAHSAIFGNSLDVGTGTTYGVSYTTASGGTTSNYLLNGSRAVFNLPAGSTVIFAELVLAAQSFSDLATPITFKTPTTTTTLPYGTVDTGFGWYAYHQDVTALISAGGAGTYEVNKVSGYIQNVGWFVYTVYTHPSFPLKYIYYTRGVLPAINGSPISFTLPNVYTPAQGPVSSFVLLASTGGDTSDRGQMRLNGNLIGNPSSSSWNGSPPYNPQLNIQPGIICIADTNDPNTGLLDVRGTFGTANNNPYSGALPNPNRAWVDLTGIDVSTVLSNNMTSIPVSLVIPNSYNSGFLVNIMAFEIRALLAPTKSVSKQLAAIGNTLTYSLSFTNAETVPYTNVTFIDTLPANVSFVPNSMLINGISSPATPSSISIGTLPINSSVTISFQATVTGTVPSSATNSSIITFNYNGGAIQTIPSNAVSTTISSAILSTSKIGKAYANIGTILTYTIPIQNIGNTTAFNIIFIDSIPSGTSLVANSFKQGATVLSGSPNPPGFTLPNPIGIGATSTVTFQVTVLTLPNPNPIPNSASQIFSYTLDNSTTPNIVNTGSAYTNTITTLINIANLSSITKGVDKDFATLDDILTYTITIPNTGTTTAGSVIFRDTIPTGTTLVPNSFKVNGIVKAGISPAPPGTNIGTIPASGTFTVSFQVTVITIPSPNLVQNSCATSFTYQVDPSVSTTVTGSAGSNIVSTTITRMAIISPTKSVNLANAFMGDTLTYTIGFKNTGTTLANTITFVDTTPNGTTFVPNSVMINGVTMTGTVLTLPGVTLPNLAVNQSATLTFQVVVVTTPTPNPTPNQGMVNYSYTDAASDTSGSDTNNTNIVSTYIYPSNNPFKGVDKSYSTVGDTLTYTLGFISALGAQENNVTFSDTIPTGTTFVPHSVFVNGVNQPGATITLPNGLNTGTLLANSLVTVSFQVVVNTLPAINPIVNQGMVSYSDTLAVGTQTRLTNTVTTQINLANFNGLTKRVDKSFTTIGDTLTYTVNFTNTGNTTAEHVVFLDAIPNDTKFVPNSIILNGVTLTGQIPDPPTGAPIGTIPADAITTITFQVVVTTLPPTNSIPNTASLTGDYLIDPTMGTTISLSGITNTVTSQVNFADLSNPIKSVDFSFADLGATLTYTITILNSGNTTANHVILIDTVPDNTNFISNSVKINGITINGISPNPLSIPIGTLPTGSTSTVTFKVFVNTLPTTNPIANSGLISYDFIVNPSIPTTSTGIHPTNTVATTINHATLGTLTKFVDLSYATCNTTITYTISIPNTGNIDALNVVLHDTLPSGTIYIPGSLQINGLSIEGTPDSIVIGTIPANNTSVVTFKVQITC